MAKKTNMIPMPTGGRVLPKIVASLVGLALLVIVVKHPGEAAGWAKALMAGLGVVLDGLVSFIQHLAG